MSATTSRTRTWTSPAARWFSDQVLAFRYDLSSTLARMALAWGGQLAQAGRIQPALDLTEKALRADPLNEALWTLLHRLHGRRSSIQARQVAARFASLLRTEGYPEPEIAAMVRGIVSQAAPALSLHPPRNLQSPRQKHRDRSSGKEKDRKDGYHSGMAAAVPGRRIRAVQYDV